MKRRLARCLDVADYTLTYPWRDARFGVAQTAADPETYLAHWLKTRQSEFQFIGLVGSVVSAMVAQLLQNPSLESSPWAAAAAFYVALVLSTMAVVTALHHTYFLNSIVFYGPPSAGLRRLLGGAPGPGLERRVWKVTFLYGTPQVLLAYAIISSMVGLSIMVISPLWSRSGSSWDGPQKIACAFIVGWFLATMSYFYGIISQYYPSQSNKT